MRVIQDLGIDSFLMLNCFHSDYFNNAMLKFLIMSFKISPTLQAILLASVLSICISCSSESKQLYSDGAATLSNINIIDVRTGDVRFNADITIAEGKIISIVDHDAAIKNPSNIIDCSNKFVIPGLWDMHTHIRSYQGEDVLPMFIVHGVVGIRDLGLTEYQLIKRWQEEIEQGQMIGPTIVSSGVIFEGPEPRFRSSVILSRVEQVGPAIDGLIEDNVTIVKLFENLPTDVYEAALKYSMEKGLRTAGHIPADWSQIRAAEAGLDSIEHLMGIDVLQPGIMSGEVSDAEIEQLASSLVENETYECPTFVGWTHYVKLAFTDTKVEEANTAITSNPNRLYVPAYFLSWWDRNLSEAERYNMSSYELTIGAAERALHLTNRLHQNGVLILAGTDTPNPWTITGESLHDELELFVRAGLSPADALQTATLNAAKYLRQSDDHGLVEEGFVADLVILDENPLENIQNLRLIDSVVKSSTVYSRQDIERIRKEQLERLADRQITDFDQHIYMDVRRYGVAEVKKRFASPDAFDGLNVEKRHFDRFAALLRDVNQFDEAALLEKWGSEILEGKGSQ